MKYYITKYNDGTYGLQQIDDPIALLSLKYHQNIKHDQTDLTYSSKLQKLFKMITITDPLIKYYYGWNVEAVDDIDKIAKIVNSDPIALLKIHHYRNISIKPDQATILKILDNEPMETIKLEVDVKEILIEEIKKLLIYHQVPDNSLLSRFLDKKGYQLIKFDEKYDEDILEKSIVKLDLTIRSYNCLLRAGVTTLKQLQYKIQNHEVIKIRNIGKKNEREIIDCFYAYLADNCPSYDLALTFTNGQDIHNFTYQDDTWRINQISEAFYQDFFGLTNNIFKENDAYFPLPLSMVLLWLGYVEIEDVIKDASYLGKHFYGLHLIEDPDYLNQRYQDYLKHHVTFYEISKEEYQQLVRQNPTNEMLYRQILKRQKQIDRLVKEMGQYFYYIDDDKEDYYNQCLDYDNLITSVNKLNCLGKKLEFINALETKYYYFNIIKPLSYYQEKVDNIFKTVSIDQINQELRNLWSNIFLSSGQQIQLEEYIEQKFKTLS
ncbi:DNA-directed RNA polymerase subunit alpha C-terminal domain-containing protein [uncultured Thomasclavelia sp.]|uniref:DNA-directed RNA polymerase subunit alpha C-terminal domain-containing protein n=1 Tax=uncultured Thomasclavelia sp. TaxID=3025759 RepID=UPI0025FDA39E|nr:DNA-directed RNA polymerase subunit alpha C-terminal domain-containing protein [uncultured Thomasclavelia sp.]